MVFGVSTACMYPKNLEQVIDQYGEMGIRDTEIFVNTFCELSPEFIRALENKVNQYKMRVHAFHPFTSGMEPLMIFSEYERRFDDMLDLYRRYFEIMQRFGAKIFVFHGDHKTSTNNASFYAQRYYKLREAARPYEVDFAQENIARCKSGNLLFLRELSDLLRDDISFVFDLKQALRSGYSPMEVLKVMGKRVVHIHANDHTIQKDCLLPGRGEFDFRGLFDYLRSIETDPSAMIEVYRGDFAVENELVKSLKYLYRIYGD